MKITRVQTLVLNLPNVFGGASAGRSPDMTTVAGSAYRAPGAFCPACPA